LNINLEDPRFDKAKRRDWKIGYASGYKMVWLQLKQIYQQSGLEMLPLELIDLNNSIEPMRIIR